MVKVAKFDTDYKRKEIVDRELRNIGLTRDQINDVFSRMPLEYIEDSLIIINAVPDDRKPEKIEYELFSHKSDAEYGLIPDDLGWEYSDYDKVDPDVRDHFLRLYDTPREGQLEIISEIHEAIQDGYKYILLEAGTGTGKSVMAATLALMYGSGTSEFHDHEFDGAYISTVTKQLQDQYMRDFEKEGFKLLKGKNNFRCKSFAENGIYEPCNYGKCLLIRDFICPYAVNASNIQYKKREDCCDYYYQKVIGEMADITVANYDYLFYNNCNQRKLAIYDEAHNIENKVMTFLTLDFEKRVLEEEINFTISKEFYKQLKEKGVREWIEFIDIVDRKYLERIGFLDSLLNVDKTVKNEAEERRLKKKMERFIQRQREINSFKKIIRANHGNWVLVYEERTDVMSFRPIRVHDYAKSMFLEFGDVNLFLSATALDYKSFAKWLGIELKELKAIRMRPPFKYENNPIKICDKLDLKYTLLPKTAPLTIPKINRILERHKDQKGIIHSVSYECRDYIRKHIDNPRLIYHDRGDRIEVLNEFAESDEPLVLVSPSMGEGVDLPYDKCRFQIIFKVPYPASTDEQATMRRNLDNDWYNYQAYVNFIQAYGRGMRKVDDWCRTYVLDSRLKRILVYDKRETKMIPDFIRIAVEADFDNIPNEQKSIKVTCPNCGCEYAKIEKICPDCGKLICDKCGAVLDATDKFCRECGNKL